MAEEGFEALFGALAAELPAIEGVERTVEVIKGVDGNDITLYIHRPSGRDGSLPGVLHLHGGGMVLLEAAGAAYDRWRDELAATGLVVVGVEFRNGGGKHGPHPFPAGLERLRVRAAWVIDHKARLGIGEDRRVGRVRRRQPDARPRRCKAKRDGLLDQIDGVYAMCPYISNAYAAPVPELTSLVENDGYFLDCRHDGRAGQGVRPDRRARHRPAGLALPRRGPTTSPGCRRT